MKILFVYLVINLLSLFLMAEDKCRARLGHLWRIPERTPFAAALVGGVGALLSMYSETTLTRHWYLWSACR